MNFGIVTVASITALCYLVGISVKATKLSHKWIPSVCGIAGLILGVAAMYAGMPDFPAQDPVTAAAIGAASGLAATGLHEVKKQIASK